MAKFTARVLGILDDIYVFVGGQRGNQEVDLQSPIVRVHDVSRQAERVSAAGSNGGYLFFNTVIDGSGGAGTHRGNFVIATGLAETNFDPVRHDLWLTGVSLETDIVAATLSAAAAIDYPASPPDIPALANQLFDAFASVEHVIVAGQHIVEPTGTCDTRPRLISNAVRIRYVVVTGIASEFITWTARMWYGAFGSTPPGMD